MSAASCAPPPIKEARAKRDKGQISAADLKKVEDQEIPKVIKKQEEVGLQCATDGEFRRMFWHFDFYGGLDGVEIYELDHGIQFQGVQTKPKSIRVTGKIDFCNHPMLEHFKFVKAHTKVMPKMCIPSPTVLHFRLEPGAVDKKAYPDRDAIFDDLAAAYRKAVKAFYDAGCRYLQFDDTAWAYLCSDVEMKKAKERGMNVDDARRRLHPRHQRRAQGQARRHGDHHPCLPRQLPLDLDLVGRLRAGRRAAAGRSATTTAISWSTTASAPAASSRCASCRRARRSWWSASSPRRAARSENKDTVKRRIDEAAKFAPLEQLALSPAMRLRLDRGGQRADRGRAVGEDARGRRDRRRGVGQVSIAGERA